MTTRWLATVIAGAGAVSWYLFLPPAPVALSSTGATTPPIRGAIHVHTRRSDGTGTVDEVAAAARRAGLQFVILTDHGDGTRGSDTPVYRFGVLCIDGVEVSTNGGHVVALDLPQTPYPLGGEAGDVLEDVRRLGGMSIAAHPDSSRAGLQWTEWSAGFDGVEWLNSDSQWRDENWLSLSRSLLTYPFRRAATLATLLDRPDRLLSEWDSLLRRRRVVAVAAADAHARVGPGDDPYRRSLSLHVPAYEQIFRTMSIALPHVQLRGEAENDARAVLDALRGGQVYSAVDAVAAPSVLSFTAVSGHHRAVMGEQLPIDGPVMLRVEANAPAGSSIKLISNGEVVASAAPPVLEFMAARVPGTYRVEIEVVGAPGRPPVPWVVSNPIYVGHPPHGEIATTSPAIVETGAVYDDGSVTHWRIEKSVRSEGTIGVVGSVDGTQLLLRYGLGGTLSESPYVAAVVPTSGELARFSHLMFTGRAVRPMRISVQLRAPGEADRRWGRSVYLDENARNVSIAFDEMTPIGAATGRPPLEEVRDLLFVVDTLNTKQGASGQFWLDEIRHAR
jgi:hypothetical protein